MLPPPTYPLDVIAQIIFVRNKYHVDPHYDVVYTKTEY